MSASPAQFDEVSVVKKANVYFGGQCISHTVLFANGSKKSIGVILPSQLTFSTAAAEVMELIDGHCRVRLKGEAGWKDYRGGESFSVPANSSFDIETLDALHYVCHFG
jgi:purine/pyrimidine-nucleoside phosphorylase